MVTVDGGPVRPHVQAFADEVERRFGLTHIMTYPGHQDTQDAALDIFADKATGDALAEWATHDEVIDRYGIRYHIWWQRIWNRSIVRAWRAMATRPGGKTPNHYDHNHFTFELTGAATPGTPTQEDDMFAENDRKTLAELQMVLLDPVHGIPKRLEEGEENDKATNAAVGRLEVAVRDQVNGISTKVNAIEAKLDTIIAKLA